MTKFRVYYSYYVAGANEDDDVIVQAVNETDAVYQARGEMGHLNRFNIFKVEEVS